MSNRDERAKTRERSRSPSIGRKTARITTNENKEFFQKELLDK
jgi:hypothetical protein